MCIILGKLKGQDDFTLEQINNAMSNNSDGSSITVIDNGKLLAMFKSVEQDKFLSYRSSIMEQYKDKWKDFDVIYHFRIATNGSVCNDNCHPFQNKHNILWHNGVISEFSADKTRVDSEQFLNKYFTHNKFSREYFEKTCDRASSSKFVVFNKDTGTIYYSKNFKVLEDGKIASNDTYTYKYEPVTYTYSGYWSDYYDDYYNDYYGYGKYKNKYIRKYESIYDEATEEVYDSREMEVMDELLNVTTTYTREELAKLPNESLYDYIDTLESMIEMSYDEIWQAVKDRIVEYKQKLRKEVI